MQIAVLGLGDIAAKAYLPILAAREGIELLLYSRSPETVGRALARYRLTRGTTSAAELLSWRPEAAFVLTPSETHLEVASRLLEAGVDVFVEKPATRHSTETRQLTQLAEALGRVLMVGFNRRHAPLHVAARGLWGGRRASHCVLAKHRDGAAHADLFSNYIDDTIHIIDLLRFFCGEGEALSTVAQVREGRLVGATSLVGLETGGHAVVTTSLEAGAWGETYSLHGEAASLEVEAFSRLRLVAGGEERVVSEGSGSWRTTLEARGFPQQIDEFLDCVTNRREPSCSGWEAYKTQRLLEAMVARLG